MRADVTIYALPIATRGPESKYMDPHVLHPSEPSLAGDPDHVASQSSFATLRISPAGSEHPRKPEIWLSGDPADARKTAQPQGDTLEYQFLGYTNPNTALVLRFQMIRDTPCLHATPVACLQSKPGNMRLGCDSSSAAAWNSESQLGLRHS